MHDKQRHDAIPEQIAISPPNAGYSVLGYDHWQL